MRYAIIDVETTGLDPETCQILELGVIIDDLVNPVPIENLPKFRCLVTHREYHGQPYAFAMHQEILYKLDNPKKHPEDTFIKNEYLAANLADFLFKNGFGKDRGGRVKAICGGKNFAGFDLQFLHELPNYSNNLSIPNRVIDVGPMYLKATDEVIPDLAECLKRAKMPSEVKHNALDDAMAVVKLIRHKLL